VAFKSKAIKQRIQQDASMPMKLDHMESKSLRDVAKPGTKAHIQKLLESPEGRKMKAEAVIEMSEAYLILLTERQKNPELTLAQKMLISAAIQECSQTIQKNEKILNSIQQSNVNETF
jgi:uncharacterized protein (UPF0128 family)